jgi:outer membrane protein assembly factor BamB
VPGIFISYRRDQTSGYAGRLYDRLTAEFGEDRVFMDLNAIDPGADFAQRIEEAIGDADALLVIIGPDWADVADGVGRRRLEDPEDFVRREVLGAIERDTLVVPVLVQGAEMPPAERLPEPLRSLGRRNAISLTDAGWSRDVTRLVATLRARIPDEPVVAGRGRATRLRVALVAAVVCAAAATGVALALGGDGDPPGDRAALRVTAQAPVGGYPLYAVTAGGKLWVAQDRQDRLKVVERDNTVSDTPALGADLSGLAVADGRLWVGDWGEDDADGVGSVVDVDPETGRPLGSPIETIEPVAVAADSESLWVANVDGVVERIDVRTRRATKRIRIGDLADVAVLDGTAWLTSLDQGLLLRYDARTGRELGRPIDVGSRPVSIAAGEAAVWVATQQGQLLRVPGGGGRPRSLPVGGEGTRIVDADAQGVWVVDEHGNVVLVDPDRVTVRARLRLRGGKLEDVALDAGGAWVLRSRTTDNSTVARVVLDPAV